jgi:hypothetical protein
MRYDMFGVEGLGCEVCERWVEKLDWGCYIIIGNGVRTTAVEEFLARLFLARLFLNRPIRISRAQNAQRHWFDGTPEGCPFQSSNEMGGTRGRLSRLNLSHWVAIGAQRRVQSRHTVTPRLPSEPSPYQ